MSYDNNPGTNPKEKLEQATAAVRAAQPDTETVQAAGNRVWQTLSAEVQSAATVELDSIHGCHDVQALLPRYHNQQLSPARVLLVEDHLRECVACRTEVEKSRRAAPLPWKQELPKARPQHFRWLATAAAVIVVAISAYVVQDRLAIPAGARARVESVNSGALYLVSLNGERRLGLGEQIMEGDRIRTSTGGHAMLRLTDGSMVEMNEHAQFSVAMRRKDTTINLDRGNIIVQAAKRRSGHLYVAAKDCLVSVTGTVFAVNSGLKGSRVSVIEGEVRVAEAGITNILHSGDQVSTSARVGSVPVQREIAWSQNLDKHLALLAEFAHLQKKLEAGVQLPELRYESKLLPLLPASTVVYAGIPNYGDALEQASKLFQQELQESAVLREWWQESQARHKGPNFDEAVHTIYQLGQYVGSEIVFSANADGHRGSALVLAQVQRPGLKDFMQNLVKSHARDDGGLQIFDPQELGQATPQPEGHGMFILVRPDLVIAAFDLATLQAFNAHLDQGGGGFGATPFGQRLASAYNSGAGLLFGADIQQMASIRSYRSEKGERTLQETGFADLKYLIAERKDVGAETSNRAELAFSGPRHGFASWLAAPGPMGGLDFVSPNAALVGALLMKSGSERYDDIARVTGISDDNFDADLARVESELQIRLKEDLANTLGGEITLALDGPLLPTPSWKIIAEVYDPARLQQTFEQLIADANAKASDGRHLSLEQQSQDGLIYYTIHFTDGQKLVEVDYTFTDGYLVLAASRALVMEAVRIHQSGNSLAKSGEFHALLPQDQFADVSALLYQNLAPVVGPIAQQLSPGQLQALQSLAAETKPSMVCAYGEESAIRVATNSKLFGLDLNTLALSTLMKMGERKSH